MPAKVEKQPAPIEKYLESFDNAVIYRYPHVVGPPALAASAFAITGAVNRWLPLTGLVVFGVLLLVVLLLGLDSAFRLPEGRERTYGLSCWAAGSSWVALAAWFGPLWAVRGLPVLALGWAVILVGAWPPWFKHRRVRRAVDVSREIAAFDGEAVGLKGVRLSKAGTKADDHAWVAPLIPEVAGTYTLDSLQRAIPRIAARLGVDQSSLTIEKVRGDREGKYQLRRDYGTRDPEGMHFEVPLEAVSMRKPFTVGVLADQKTPMQIEVWRKGHGGVDSIVAGQKGYGKTTGYKRIGIHAGAAHDGLLMIGDMKPGSPDYDVLSRLAYAYGRSADDMDIMIRALHIICRVRGENKRKDRMVIVALFDETSLYFAPTQADTTRQASSEAARKDMQRRYQWETLCAISRAFDMALYAATQRCEPQTIGGNNARAALLAGQVVGFYSPKARDSALLSSDGKLTMHTLPRGRKGECWISNQIHGEPVRGRWHNVTDAQELETVERFEGLEKDLHDDELAALRDELGDAWNRLRPAIRHDSSVTNGGEQGGDSSANSSAGSPGESPLTVVPDSPEEAPANRQTEPAEVRPKRAASAADSQLEVWNVLRALRGPAMVSSVAEAWGKSEQITRARLNELVDMGCVDRTGKTRWIKYRAIVSPAETPADVDA